MNTKRAFVVRGARVVTPGKDLGVVDVRIESGRIAAVGSDVARCEGDRVVEADGLTLLPGFVDIHSHGRGGADFWIRAVLYGIPLRKRGAFRRERRGQAEA